MKRRRLLLGIAVLVLLGGAAGLVYRMAGSGRDGSGVRKGGDGKSAEPGADRSPGGEEKRKEPPDSAEAGGRNPVAGESQGSRQEGAGAPEPKLGDGATSPDDGERKARRLHEQKEGPADARGEPAEPEDSSRALGSISGTVRGAEGKPVAGARVEASAGKARRQHGTVSGSDGEFTFDGLSEGLYLLSAEKDGTEGTAGPVPATGDETTHVTIFLGSDASIAGQILDESTHEGVAGISINFRDAVRQVSSVAYSDTDGRFRTSVLAPAVYAAWVERHPEYYTERSSHMNVAVAAGEHKDGLVLTVRKGVTLRGNVQTVGGDPVPDATVLLDDLLSGIGGEKGQTVSDTAGRFVFSGQNPSGRFVARAVHPDHGYGQSEPLLARAGGEQPEMVVRLMAGASIRGRLVTDDGAGVAGLDVWLGLAETRGRVPGTRKVSGPDGRFTMSHVAPGMYRFEVITAQNEEGWTDLLSREFTVIEGDEPEEVVVSVGPGPYGFVEGRVTSPEGDPLPLVEVLAWSRDPRVGGAQNSTDADGRYRIDGLGPARTVAVEARGFRLGRFRKELLDVPVSSSGVDFVLGRMASLSGRVVDAETREGLTSFHVSGPIVDMDIESPDGSFTIAQLQMDHGQFVFSAPGYKTATWDAGTIAEGAEIKDVLVEMHPGEWLEGTVTAADSGAPVAGARVKYLQSGQEVPAVDHPSTWTSADPFTDAQGRFYLPGNPPGQPNSFVVWHQDYVAAVVRDSLDRTFQIVLQK